MLWMCVPSVVRNQIDRSRHSDYLELDVFWTALLQEEMWCSLDGSKVIPSYIYLQSITVRLAFQENLDECDINFLPSILTDKKQTKKLSNDLFKLGGRF